MQHKVYSDLDKVLGIVTKKFAFAVDSCAIIDIFLEVWHYVRNLSETETRWKPSWKVHKPKPTGTNKLTRGLKLILAYMPYTTIDLRTSYPCSKLPLCVQCCVKMGFLLLSQIGMLSSGLLYLARCCFWSHFKVCFHESKHTISSFDGIIKVFVVLIFLPVIRKEK